MHLHRLKANFRFIVDEPWGLMTKLFVSQNSEDERWSTIKNFHRRLESKFIVQDQKIIDFSDEH